MSVVLLRTITQPAVSGLRVLELLPRTTVWRHDADSEAIRTYSRRVRVGKLQHSESALLLHICGLI